MPRGSTMKTFATHTHILEILNISNNNKKALEKYGIWYKVPAALCIIIIIIKNASSSQANCERDPGRCTAGIFTHTWQQPLFSALYCVCHNSNCPCAKWGKFSQALYFYSETLCSKCHKTVLCLTKYWCQFKNISTKFLLIFGELLLVLKRSAQKRAWFIPKPKMYWRLKCSSSREGK